MYWKVVGWVGGLIILGMAIFLLYFWYQTWQEKTIVLNGTDAVQWRTVEDGDRFTLVARNIPGKFDFIVVQEVGVDTNVVDLSVLEDTKTGRMLIRINEFGDFRFLIKPVK